MTALKKVGREVLFIPTSAQNPRNGESTMIRLKDGSILHAFTEYYGTCGEDHGTARISACVSHDEGESWSERFILLDKDPDAQNIMSASLLRMDNGDLGIMYLRKGITPDGGVNCLPVFRRSADEGKSWSPMQVCLPEGYYTPFNSCLLRLKSGRILYPLTYYCRQYDAFRRHIDAGRPDTGPYGLILYSDDDGATWEALPHRFYTPFPDRKMGLTEPSVYEHENGDLWIWFRTMYGHQYQSFSADGGNTWSQLVPNLFFTSPDAPMQMRRVGDYTIAVYNPIPFHSVNFGFESWMAPKRTPLILAVSCKDGREFAVNFAHYAGTRPDLMHNQLFYLEDDPASSYCYPAIFEGPDYFLVSYYHSNGGKECLNCSKVVKVRMEELRTVKESC
jgi:hypothetical protein